MEKLSKKISVAAFIFAFTVVLINVVSVVFPSLIAVLANYNEIEGNPYELGSWSVPIIATNVFLLCFGILYYKKSLPKIIYDSMKFITTFEVSRNVATVVFVILLFGYIGLAMEDLANDEGDTWGDFRTVEQVAKDWPFNKGAELKSLEVLHVKNFLLKSSIVVFQNIKVIPFIGTIALLSLTCFFTTLITKKRFAGLASMLVLLQSHTFLQFDTLATYDNFWILLYLFSLYSMYKKWYLSPIAYFASLFSKPLTAAFLPMSLFFTYRAEMPKRRKILLSISYVIILVIIAGTIFVVNIGFTRVTPFSYVDFINGFTTWSFQLRFDSLLLIFALPVTVGLFIISRRGIQQADSVLILIAGIILAMPLMAALSGYNIHPYRYVSLIVFFSIGVGTLLSKSIKQEV